MQFVRVLLTESMETLFKFQAVQPAQCRLFAVLVIIEYDVVNLEIMCALLPQQHAGCRLIYLNLLKLCLVSLPAMKRNFATRNQA